MFGHNSFVWTPVSVNRVLASPTATSSSDDQFLSINEKPNAITMFWNQGRRRYGVEFPESSRTGSLMGKGVDTLALAIAEATSGTNSTSLTYRIDSYWDEDKTAAIAAGATDFPCYEGWCDATAIYDENNDGSGRIPYDCAEEENRKTNLDGSCGFCLDGYTEDADGVCIADPCTDSNRKTLTDGSCDTDCKDGYEFDSDDKCVAVSGNGEEAEGSNMGLIIGGVVVLGLGGWFYSQKKSKKDK